MDSNLIFVDFRSGQLVGVVDLESRFHVTSILWVSDSLLYIGCSTGVLFAVNYSPGAEFPIEMRPVVTPFTSPITALALDPMRGFLGVGCAGDAFVFSRPKFEDINSWELVDHIPTPSNNLQGLVTSLIFYTTPTGESQLFIGYAKEGFCIWRGPHNHQPTPQIYNADKGICSIGSAVLSADGRFIAVVTLDHAIVLYPLTINGPAIYERQVIQTQESGPFFIVPIALTANNLVLRGTASGTVPVVDLQNGPVAPIINDPTEVVRALATYADKVVVGVSAPTGMGSQIKCYRDLAVSMSTQVSRLPKEANRPVFEVAIRQLEERSGSFRTLDANFATILQNRRIWTWMGLIWALVTILVIDPPELPDSINKTNAYAVPTTPAPFSNELAVLSFNRTTEYPTLGFLFSYCVLFIASRFSWWGTWCLSWCGYLFGAGFHMIIWMASVVPYTIRWVMTNLPRWLSAATCEVLQAFGDVEFCPKRG
ncbi:hypothetical protein RSAG8_10093, partial [Rhizoctonia solani AG-8 WAC10335]